jgi:hypothetical protein
MVPNLYINWVLYAVYGLMAEADALQRMHGAAIAAVADELQRRHPIAPAPLYRGILLAAPDTLRPEPNLQFLSWSEDRDVARWFGSPESYISAPFAAYAPEARGYALLLERPTTRVLFHHSWRCAFGMPLERLALVHPLLGHEGARQVAWSLDTQHEVITEPLATLPTPLPIGELAGAPIDELDGRLSPPWVS